MAMRRQRHTAKGRRCGALLGSLVLFVGLAACTHDAGYQPTLAGAWRARSVSGDWDDVRAAAIVAARAAGATIASSHIEQDRARFELVTVTGEPGVLIVTREGDALRARCRIGRFGDEERETQLLKALAERLSDLRGVEFAPL